MILIHPTQFVCPARIRQIEVATGLMASVRAGRVVLVPRPAMRDRPYTLRRPSDDPAPPAA